MKNLWVIITIAASMLTISSCSSQYEFEDDTPFINAPQAMRYEFEDDTPLINAPQAQQYEFEDDTPFIVDKGHRTVKFKK